MEMETEDDVDGNADPPSSAAPLVAEIQPEITALRRSEERVEAQNLSERVSGEVGI
jgi:hypothetical protein